ncbi:hypothetical protein ACHAPT_004315 [Fusarium lateritium]
MDQDNNTSFKPASAATQNPLVVNALADTAGLDKQAMDGDNSSVSPTKQDEGLDTKPVSIITQNPLVVNALADTAGLGKRAVDDDSSSISPTQPNSTVSSKDDAVVLTAGPPTMELGSDHDVLPPNKKPKVMAEQSDNESRKSPSTTELQPPPVNDFEDFTGYGQLCVTNKKGEILSLHIFVTLFDEANHALWGASVEGSKEEVKLEQLINCLCRVPDRTIYPPASPDMPTTTTSGFTLEKDAWLKRPQVRGYTASMGDSTVIADQFLDEIRAHQVVEEHPHRNLVKFKGCLVKDGLVVGVLQKRYPMTLNWRVEAWSQPLYDPAALFADIEAGLKHLHSLGFAHNDLNQNNVMVDAEDRPVIIDLGSAKPLGERLFQAGTQGWNDGFEKVSSVANDEIGLAVMKKYLQDNLVKDYGKGDDQEEDDQEEDDRKEDDREDE